MHNHQYLLIYKLKFYGQLMFSAFQNIQEHNNLKILAQVINKILQIGLFAI